MATNIEHIGNNSNERNEYELKMLKRIISAHSEDQTKEEKIKLNLISVKLRMNQYLKEDNKSELIPAGFFLNEILNSLKIKKSKFADYIDIESSNLHAILKGRRKINNKIAAQIATIFNINEELWMFIEAKNELINYRKSTKDSSKNYSIEELVG